MCDYNYSCASIILSLLKLLSSGSKTGGRDPQVGRLPFLWDVFKH